MTGIWYFSATGHSEAVARYFAAALDAPLHAIGDGDPPLLATAVVVFPVYCQNVPLPVKRFLPRLKAENIVLIATYGKMGYGNVLSDAAALVQGRIIAGACFPTGHTYLEHDSWGDPAVLQPILERIQNPLPVQIPTGRKWWLADILPGLRGRIGVRMTRTDACTACGICERLCPMKTMKPGKPGKPGKNCIRCLGCAENCPAHAINVTCHPLLRRYLRKPRQTDLVLYL